LHAASPLVPAPTTATRFALCSIDRCYFFSAMVSTKIDLYADVLILVFRGHWQYYMPARGSCAAFYNPKGVTLLQLATTMCSAVQRLVALKRE
jgi:hypothetical protein